MTDFIDMTKAELAALIGGMTASQIKKTSHADLVQMAGEKARVQPKADKPARKPRGLDDRVIQAPGMVEDVRPTKEGSKRALLIQALARGCTLEHLESLLGWNRATVSSALRTDVGAVGLGVERKGGKYFLLLPAGMSKLPLRDATTSRADALVAACGK